MKQDFDDAIVFEWSDVARLLFKAKGINSGYYRLALKLRLAGTTAPFSEEKGGASQFLPTGMIGIDSLALMPADAPGPMVFNAAGGVENKSSPSGTVLNNRKLAPRPSGLGALKPKKAIPARAPGKS